MFYFCTYVETFVNLCMHSELRHKIFFRSVQPAIHEPPWYRADCPDISDSPRRKFRAHVWTKQLSGERMRRDLSCFGVGWQLHCRVLGVSRHGRAERVK